MKKRLLAIFLSLCLTLSLLPVTALASGDGVQENYVVLELEFGANVSAEDQAAAMAEYANETYASCSEANEAYMALFGITWTSEGILNITNQNAPLYNYRETPGSVSMVTFTVHGSVPGFTSLTSAGNNIDCTVGGNHQLFRTSYTIQGVDNLDGSQAQITSGNIQAYVAGGYPSAFTKSGTLTIQNIEFTVPAPDSRNPSNRYITLAASAAPLDNAAEIVDSASMIVKDCTFNGYVYLYDNFNNRDVMTYTIQDNVFLCEDQSRAIFIQSNYGPSEVNIIDNFITAKTWVVDCNVAGADFYLQGNTITKTEDTRGAAVQLSNGQSFQIEGNTITSAGNAFWIYDGTTSIIPNTPIAVTGNTIDAKYLICDSGKGSQQTWTGNTISPATDVTQGRLNNPSSEKEEFQPVLDTTASAVKNNTNYISVAGVRGLEGSKYPTFAAAADAINEIGSASGAVILTVNGQMDISSQLYDNKTTLDLSGVTGLTGLTIRGADGNAQIISGVNGNDIDGPYCPVLTVKLPAGTALTVEDLTFPNDLLFDTHKGGTLVVQNCVFNGGQSGYPQAGSISYLNNTFEFKGTAANFFTNNAYPVWYKTNGDLDFRFDGNTVIGYRGVHVETRGGEDDAPAHSVNIAVDNNHFYLSDADHANKTIALQLVRNLNGDISFTNNYVDAYMAVCFFNGIQWVDGSLNIQNNQLSSGCKFYGSNEWNAPGDTAAEKEAAADEFAQDFVNGIPSESKTISAGHTEHYYVNGVCTICGEKEPTIDYGGGSSSVSGDYIVFVDTTTGGKVTASPGRADKGDTVTITVKPNDGYELDELFVTDKNGDTVKVTSKGNNKYTFTMPASKVTVEASFVKAGETNPSALPFIDVNVGDYFYDAVAWAVENGVTAGTSATTFSPNASCTRAQTVTFLWRAAGSPEPKTTSNPFTDVKESDYYYEAVLWAVENSITAGTSATTFSPNATCTRGQVVTFLYRYDGTATTAGTNFTDVSEGAYYYDAVQWAAQSGITTGTTATTFSPDANCTRGQIVTFLFRDLAE